MEAQFKVESWPAAKDGSEPGSYIAFATRYSLLCWEGPICSVSFVVGKEIGSGMEPASIIAKLLVEDLPDDAKEHLQIALDLLGKRSVPVPAGAHAPNGFFKIPGYGKRYAITKHGEIFSYSRKRLLKPWENDRDKYLRVDLTPDEGGRQKKELVHNLVILTFQGVRPPNNVVRHLDDDPRNNSLENLRYGTRAQNSADLVRNGRRPRRFTEEQEEEIRHRHFIGETQADLAKEFGCSSRTIWKVVNQTYSDGSA